MAEYFGWKSISVGDLLKKEVSKKSEYGKAISDALKHYKYGNSNLFVITKRIVDDNIVIDLVKKQILQYEKENLSWIIEGFPRTKV